MKTALSWIDWVSQGRIAHTHGGARLLAPSNAATNDVTRLAEFYPSGPSPSFVRVDFGATRDVRLVAALNVLFSPVGTAGLRVRLRLRDAGLAEVAVKTVVLPANGARIPDRDVYWYLSSTVRARFLDVLANSTFDPESQIETDGLGTGLNVGRLWVGPALVVNDAASEDWSLTIEDTGEAVQVVGGSTITNELGRRRRLRFRLEGLTSDEAYGVSAYGSARVLGVQDMLHAAASTRPVLAMMRADEVTQGPVESNLFGWMPQPARLTRATSTDEGFDAPIDVREAIR